MKKRRILATAICFTLLCCVTVVKAAKSKSVIELKVGNDVYTGRLEAKNSNTAWLMNRDGKIEKVNLKKVTKYRKVSSRFKPKTGLELRNSLYREFGKKYEVASRGRYLVVAPKGRAKEYAEVFDDLNRTFNRYFSVRGFRISKPEFPMVAIVFKTHAEFIEYTKKDSFKAIQGLAGYYYPQNNRVALFESTRRTISGLNVGEQETTPFADNFGWFAKAGGRTSAANGLRDTMIHEATHQVAYNVGLHSRLGDNPRWVVEGLATMLEPEGARKNSKSGSAMKRINRQRYMRFQDFAKNRRQPKSLKAFIESGAMFHANVLDFYAQSWALSFYLSETSSRQYSKYLKTISSRPSLNEYSKAKRLGDFEKAFGKKVESVEFNFLRYMKRLK